MIKENQAEFDICGINKFWSKGYTGKGIKVANMEKTNPDLWFFDGKVSTPTGHVYDKFENYHGNQTMDCIHQVAPDADLITLSKSAKSSNNYIEGVIIDVSIPYMINNGVHLVNASLGGNNNKMLNDIIVNAQSHGVVFCASAGNVAEKGLKGYAKSNKWISVGAVHYYDHDKKTKLASYSSRGKELDITCFSNLHIHDARKDYKGRTFPVEGTSFSSPMFTGMLALVQQFFLEEIGRTLYQDEIELFIQDHVVDLGAEGWDEMYGHGLFILPNPEDIIIKDYVNVSDNNIGDDIMDFKDVDKNRWSAKNIDLVSDLGLMNGYPDGTFKPAQPVTREEIATVLANLVNNFNVKQK